MLGSIWKLRLFGHWPSSEYGPHKVAARCGLVREEIYHALKLRQRQSATACTLKSKGTALCHEMWWPKKSITSPKWQFAELKIRPYTSRHRKTFQLTVNLVPNVPIEDPLVVLSSRPLPLDDSFKLAGGRKLFWDPESTTFSPAGCRGSNATEWRNI